MNENNSKVLHAIVGYSGHAFVAIDILKSCGLVVSAYLDFEEKKNNPYAIPYLGSENDLAVIELLRNYQYFVGIGDNHIRRKIIEHLILKLNFTPINATHQNSNVSSNVKLGFGNLIAAGATINPCVMIGNGVICNTQSSIDHECVIENYVHIAPGAVLCGNVHVGENSFIGANSVIKQGIRIGKNVIIGAGSVVVKDVLESGIYAGNPTKKIIKR